MKFLSGFLLLVTIFAISITESSAQNKYDVKGTVKKSRKKTEGAIITLYKGSSQVSQQTTTSNGRFQVIMDLNAEYTLTISKPGHISKKFYFNTKGVPEERAKEEFGGQDIEVSIFEMPKDPSVVSQINQILSQPMAKFYYDDKMKEIDFDKGYSQSMLDALSKLNQIEQEAIKKAEEETKTKTASESAAASKYEAAIIKGDAALAKKDYTSARVAFTDALGIKPGEEYPKNKIIEIEKLIADAAKNAALDADYKAAIAKADAAFTAKNFVVAKVSYNDALKLKSAEAYPKTKLDEITKLQADASKLDELEAKYKTALQKGDTDFNAKSYESSKAAYSEASVLKPAEKYPKDKIAEIDKLLTDILAKEKAQKELDDKYKAIVSNADKSFASKMYSSSKTSYEEALKLKPTEQYPKTKIQEIEKLLADIAAKENSEKALTEKYTAAISKGDKALAAKEYVNAKGAFSEAIALRALEQYPKDKILEIDKAIADAAAKDAAEKDRLVKEKALADKYNAAIAKGDAALTKKDYTTAKLGYTEAISLKSAEQYPKDKLSEIDKALAEVAKEAALELKYKAAIAKADAAMKAKIFDVAKAAYNEALLLKSAEQYPKDKLADIEGLLSKDAASKELNEKYTAALTKADASFKTKSYEDAKTGYNEALGFKPAEAYPKAQLAAIEKAIADAAEKDAAEKDRLAKEKERAEKYASAIAKADAALSSKEYTVAKLAYNEALTLKATEKYPKDKIAEINAILAKEMGAMELEKKYADAISKGDVGFGSKEYTSAKLQYTAALALKPNEQYPKDKLAEVEKALAEIASANKGKEMEAKYASAISKADAAFSAKTYAVAKTAYNEALLIKSLEQYPKDKIAEIDLLLASDAVEKARLAKEKEVETKYKSAIAKGDAAFKLKTYAAAKTAYTEAIGVKPAEQYPSDKISEIESLIASASSEKDRLAQEVKYKSAIAKGDAAFKTKTYVAAKTAYNEALSIKSAEQYPKDKISEIDTILSELATKDAASKEINAKYAAAIATGDKAFELKDYDAAKSAYSDAIAFKSAEKYPKDKLASIDALLAKDAGLKEIESKYNASIQKADEEFTAKNYAAAKVSYTEASSLKSAEQYPKDQLQKVNSFLMDLAKTQALQVKYDVAIAKADGVLEKKDYTNALASYKEAQLIKPNEPYPSNKISEINATISGLALQKEKDAEYLDLITKADKLFALKDYKSSKSRYLDASLVKSSEQYPKNKVAEIDVLLKKKNTTTTSVSNTTKDDFKSELAKKYPEGITEESASENNAKVTRRIVVKGLEGHLYVRKETSFGPIYFFKDNVSITETEYLRDTEVQPQ